MKKEKRVPKLSRNVLLLIISKRLERNTSLKSTPDGKEAYTIYLTPQEYEDISSKSKRFTPLVSEDIDIDDTSSFYGE